MVVFCSGARQIDGESAPSNHKALLVSGIIGRNKYGAMANPVARPLLALEERELDPALSLRPCIYGAAMDRSDRSRGGFFDLISLE